MSKGVENAADAPRPELPTLRDYFAAEALAGMWANPSIVYQQPDLAKKGGQDDLRDMARDAYAVADAMLAARERKDGP